MTQEYTDKTQLRKSKKLAYIKLMQFAKIIGVFLPAKEVKNFLDVNLNSPKFAVFCSLRIPKGADATFYYQDAGKGVTIGIISGKDRQRIFINATKL